jgi:hypothetical protein
MGTSLLIFVVAETGASVSLLLLLFRRLGSIYRAVAYQQITPSQYEIISKYVKSIGQAFLICLVYEVNAVIVTKTSYSVS